MEPIELAREVVDILEDKLAEDIMLLDIRDHSPFTDYFVICSANSERQIRALASSVREETKKHKNVLPRNIEGEPFSGWVLMDYIDVIVHIFAPEVRAYYDLEGLWQEGKVLLHMQ